MPRLKRPYIPLPIRCHVVLRQLGEIFIPACMDVAKKDGYRSYLVRHLADLARLMNTTPRELHLDHDPPLGARRKVFDEAGNFVDYDPPANHPDHLGYRPAAHHRIKTNVRGDGAQFPDRVLIKRNRRLEQSKTAEDVAEKPRIYGMRTRHVGIRKASRPLPGNRRSPFKRKINGEVVRR